LGTLSDIRGFPRFILSAGVAAGILLVVFTYISSLILGLILFFFTPNGLQFTKSNLQGFNIYVFYTLGFYVPLKVNAGFFFLFLWSIFAACMVIAGMGPRENLLEAVWKSFRKPLSRLLSENCLFSLPILSSMLLLAVNTVYLIQEALGIPSGSIPLSNPFEVLLIGCYASVAEEVSFRFIPLGITSMAYLLKVGQVKLETMTAKERFKLIIITILNPESVRSRLGLRSIRNDGWLQGVSVPEWLMLIFSALGFGIAHPLVGIGWEIGKVTTTFIGGVAFGLVFLFYGAHASILMHWFIDYYLLIYAFGNEFFSQLSPLAAIVDFMTLTFGVLGWAALSIFLLAKALRKPRGESVNILPETDAT